MERERQLHLWRLFASMTCLATALGLIRYVWWAVPKYGGGDLPAAAVIASLFLAVAGVGVLFKRAREWMLWLLFGILRLLNP
jgi:hypothetical protein